MTRDSEATRKRHHELSQAILKMQTKNVQKLVSTIEGFINPFSYQENDIIKKSGYKSCSYARENQTGYMPY